jgi:hypothetical protein
MLHENIAREEAQLQKLARVGTPQAIQMLRQYAQTHQDDAIRLSLANQAVNDAKEMHSKALAMLSGQQPPTVAQQVVQSIGGQGGAPMPPAGGPQAPMPPQGMPPAPPPGMQMPPQAPPAPQGLAGLPAPNMEQMADGGIAGYADGGEIRMAGGGLDEDAIRAGGRQLGMSNQQIEEHIQRERAAAQMPQRQLPYIPANTEAIVPPQLRWADTTLSAYEGSANPPTTPNARMTGASPAVGPDTQPRKPDFVDAIKAKYPTPGSTYGDVSSSPEQIRLAQQTPLPGRPATVPNVIEAGAVNQGLANALSHAARGRAYLDESGVPRFGSMPVRMPKEAAAPEVAPPPPPTSQYRLPQQSVPVPSGLARLLNPEKMSVADAKAAASGLNNSDQIQALLSTRGAEHKAVLDELERRRGELFKPLEKPEETAGAKYIAKQREELAGDRETMKSQALIDVGLAIASGKSGRGLVNIAEGLSKGNEMYKSALKEFKAAGKDIDKMQLLESERRKAEEQGRSKDELAYSERIAGLKEQHAENTMKTMVDKLGIDSKVASDLYANSQSNARADVRAGVGVQAQMAEANARLNQLPEQARFAMLLGGGDVKTGMQVMQDLKNSPMEVYMSLTQATASYNKNLPVGETPLKPPSMAEVANLMRESRAYQNMPSPVDMSGKLPSSMLMQGGPKAGPLAEELKKAMTPGPKTIVPTPGYNLYGYGR